MKSEPEADQLRRELRTRVRELAAAGEHIERLEDQLLALKDVKRELQEARGEKEKLRKSAEHKFGRALLAPLRLIGRWRGRAQKSPTSPSALEYRAWLARHRSSAGELERTFSFAPLFSILTPVYNTRAAWLEEMVASVAAQVYQNWELILVDDCSTNPETRAALAKISGRDPRIRLFRNERREGIAGASNRALAEARGEWIGILDHDDVLEPDALYRNVEVLQTEPELDLIYSDEDKIIAGGFDAPSLKPDWSPEFFLSYNYLCHFTVLRRALVVEAGGFRLGFDGAQDYDLFLRVTERTQRIHHLPRVLYHWRRTADSTSDNIRRKPGALEAGRRALEDALVRRGEEGHVTVDWRTHAYRVRRALRPLQKICIIVSATTKPDRLRAQTDYECFEIVTAQNAHERNHAARKTECPCLLFLRGDLEPLNPDWLEIMAELIQRDEIGAAGARLLSDDDKVAHAGLIFGTSAGLESAFHGFAAEAPGVNRQLQVTRDYGAVAGAILLRRAVFEQVDGFDPELEEAAGEVDLCLKIRRAGYRIVATPFARLRGQRGLEFSPAAIAFLRARWPEWFVRDPFYHPQLSRRHADFSLG